MSFLRPAAVARLKRLSGLCEAILPLGLGAWVFSLGGPLWGLIGLGLIGLGAAWGVSAFWRMRFQAEPTAPGLIEVDEARVRFIHPVMAGEISLDELTSLSLVETRGRKLWRLEDAFGVKLLLPLDTAGAEALFDAFAALPGLSLAVLAQSLKSPQPEGTGLLMQGHVETVLWRRDGRGKAHSLRVV